MKLAIISDVHGDVHALSDALAQIDRLGCEVTICAGDVLDYGSFPEETIALLRERRIPTIRGNHDRWAIGRGRADQPDDVDLDLFTDASGWDLSRESLVFLAELPLTWRATIGGVRVAVAHARPGSDIEGILPVEATPEFVDQLLQEAQADVLLVGHTHVPLVAIGRSGGLLANPGALLRDPASSLDWDDEAVDPETGQIIRAPAPGGGTFGVLVLPAKRFTVHRAGDGGEVFADGLR